MQQQAPCSSREEQSLVQSRVLVLLKADAATSSCSSREEQSLIQRRILGTGKGFVDHSLWQEEAL